MLQARATCNRGSKKEIRKRQREGEKEYKYLFMCSLFNDAVSNSGYTASIFWTIRDELERLWKESALRSLLWRHLPGMAEQWHEEPQFRIVALVAYRLGCDTM
jgi:hypothetical protein